MKIVYEDGTISDDRCLRSPFADKEDRVKDYERWGLVALENGDWNKSDIYFEWARLERDEK